MPKTNKYNGRIKKIYKEVTQEIEKYVSTERKSNQVERQGSKRKRQTFYKREER